MNVLKIGRYQQKHLWAHLLPKDTKKEQAAFLFCTVDRDGEGLVFKTLDQQLLRAADFAAQYEDYIELTDNTRISLIKQAHKADAVLVEIHSHPGPWPAAFSLSDRRGLRETVPHMRWRLKQRPYLAIVVAPSGFDALVWSDNPIVPEPLDGIEIDGQISRPTNNSLEGWTDDQ